MTTQTASGAQGVQQEADHLLDVTGLKMYFPVTAGLFVQKKVADVKAVDGLSFHVKRGETLGLVGESGCGKSTTGRAIIRLYKPTEGSVVFDGTEMTKLEGTDLRRFRRRMQMIFQDPYSSLNPRQTVRQLLKEAILLHKIVDRSAVNDYIIELCKTVGLRADAVDKFPHEFSGGQRQRIGIARALSVKPRFMVADEPTSALDVSIQAQVINLLMDLQEEFGLSYLFISHDMAVIQHVCKRIAVMYKGRIVEEGSREEIIENPQHRYTQSLLSAVPEPDPHRERERIVFDGGAM